MNSDLLDTLKRYRVEGLEVDHNKAVGDMVASLVVDIEGTAPEKYRIISASKPALDLFGNVVGQMVNDLVPDRYKTTHLAMMREFVESGSQELNMNRGKVAGIGRGGEEVDLMIRLARKEVDHRDVVVAVVFTF